MRFPRTVFWVRLEAFPQTFSDASSRAAFPDTFPRYVFLETFPQRRFCRCGGNCSTCEIPLLALVIRIFSRVPSPDVCNPGSFPGYVCSDIFQRRIQIQLQRRPPNTFCGGVLPGRFRGRFRTRCLRERFQRRCTESCFVHGFWDVCQIRFS